MSVLRTTPFRKIEISAGIKLGEFLKEIQKNKGAKGSVVTGNTREPVKDATPTLDEIGVSKKLSSEAQILASLSEEEKTKVIKQKKSKRAALKEAAKKRRAALEAQAQKRISEEKKKSLRNVCDIRCCSIEDLFKSGIKPDAVITDPPYSKKYLPLYESLAIHCKNIPLVAVMCGQSYLPDVIHLMCKHLNYRWMLAYLTPGGQSVQQWPCKINTFWKPVLLFGEAKQWIGDVCESAVNDNDKRFQSTEVLILRRYSGRE